VDLLFQRMELPLGLQINVGHFAAAFDDILAKPDPFLLFQP
jgi:hypothetical protein